MSQATYTFDVNVKRDSVQHENNEIRIAEYKARQVVHLLDRKAPGIKIERVA